MSKSRWSHPSVGLIRFWINKLSKRNRFLRPFLIRRYEKAPFWGLIVFIIREKACSELGLGPKICQIIEEHGLDQVSKSYETICNYTQKELRW